MGTGNLLAFQVGCKAGLFLHDLLACTAYVAPVIGSIPGIRVAIDEGVRFLAKIDDDEIPLEVFAHPGEAIVGIGSAAGSVESVEPFGADFLLLKCGADGCRGAKISGGNDDGSIILNEDGIGGGKYCRVGYRFGSRSVAGFDDRFR